MSGDVVQLVEWAGPHLVAALKAYGSGVLTRTENAAADQTANLGRRILQAVWRRRGEQEQAALEQAVGEAAEEPQDADAVAALRQQIKRALREDEELRRELADLFSQAPQSSVVASGERAIASGTNSGVQITGDNAQVTR